LRRNAFLAGCTLTLAACGSSSPPTISPADRASEVNPFVGTQSGAQDFGTGGGAGNTYPGAVLPFGMIQFSPDTSPTLDNFAAGYSYGDSRMEGFTLTHLSGAGCATFRDVPILPTVMPITSSPVPLGRAGWNAGFDVAFDHEHEAAEPGYYGVVLDPKGDQPIDVELTASDRAGMARFRFPSTSAASVLINAGGSEMANAAASVHIDPSSSEVSGSASSGRFCFQDSQYTLYFVIRFDRPFSALGTWQKALLAPGSTDSSDVSLFPLNPEPIPGGPQSVPGDPSGTAQAGAYLSFDTTSDALVQMRVGISFVSVDNARANLDAETAGRSFDEIRAAARERWNAALGQIEIATSDPRLRRIFYTSLYHSLLAPTLFSDADGRYRGMDGAIHAAAGFRMYGTFSGWDIYRSQMPLLAMLDPARTSDMMQSLVVDAAESGWLPKWSYANQHTDVMVGDPAPILLAGAFALGARDFDTGAALQAMIKGATQIASPLQYALGGNAGYIERPGLAEYETLGYVPFEENVPSGAFGLVHRGLVWGSASTTLEYALADFAVDHFAEMLGEQAQTASLRARSASWRALFNPASGFIEPKLASGLFVPGGDPSSGNGFVEGDSAQYSWFVPHDVGGLIDAMGGVDAGSARLDDFFSELNAGPSSPHAFLGNEPTLFTPWLYEWTGAPAKTGPIVHAALQTLYDDAATGMPGNDDLGTMSAWWVLSSLGFCACVPGTDLLLLSAPLFDATLHLPGGDLRIRRSGEGDRVRSVTLNGQRLTRAWLRFDEIGHGGELVYELGTQAGDWGVAAADAPPSFPADR